VLPPPDIKSVPDLSTQGIRITEPLVLKLTFCRPCAWLASCTATIVAGTMPHTILAAGYMITIKKLGYTVAYVFVYACLGSAADADQGLRQKNFESFCSTGSSFTKCDISLNSEKLKSISMNGLVEIRICSELSDVAFRSNPSSPYQKIEGTVGGGDLMKLVKSEDGIDHDFLLRYTVSNSSTKNRLIIRFKNKFIAEGFISELNKSTANCLR